MFVVDGLLMLLLLLIFFYCWSDTSEDRLKPLVQSRKSKVKKQSDNKKENY